VKSLFEENPDSLLIPLAERMRPKSIEKFAGQEHLLGEGKPLSALIKSGEIYNMILWGPPGTGKTTLAGLIAAETNSTMIQLSAISSGVKDVRDAIAEAKHRLETSLVKTILFIDEIHRFNKAQQDSLLNATEKGWIILIGATTENPSFEIISPLLSRSRVFVLEPLSKGNLEKILNNAISEDLFLSQFEIEIEDKNFLFEISGSDARKMLNGFELAVKLGAKENKAELSNELLKQSFQVNYIKYDKNREEHYNVISAFIKSMRGSDPDAAVYWMARMIDGGEDPKFIARRMIVLASEDIGNADPQALNVACNAFHAVNFIGMPEASIVLSQAAVYLALAPKSNASYMAIKNALDEVKNNPVPDVPLHLRNAPTKLMKDLYYGRDYQYDHDFENHFSGQSFLPPELKDKEFYIPTVNGFESELKRKLEILRKIRSEKNSEKRYGSGKK
jgi:ATPase related to the helicase subunit of the Holliday junction resolvase